MKFNKTVMSGNSLFNFLNFLFLILFFGAPHLLMTSRSVSPVTVQVYGYLSVYIQGVPCISPCVTCDQLPSKAVNKIDYFYCYILEILISLLTSSHNMRHKMFCTSLNMIEGDL